MQRPASGWMRISELSHRVGVSADTLRAWERRYGVLRPRRTRGNQRRYSAIDEARVRLMQRLMADRLPAAQAAEMAMAAQFSLRPGSTPKLPDHEVQRAGAELRAALDAFDETSAERTLQQLLGSYTPTAVLRDVAIPQLRELGERSANDDMSIAQAQFAIAFFHSRLLALARGWDRGLGPQALLAAAPGDFHTLGLICFGISLHRLGWRITFLGAATPTHVLNQAAVVTGAELAVVSCSVRGLLEPQVEALRSLGGRIRLVIAGPASDPELAARCAAEHPGEDPVSAAGRLALPGPRPAGVPFRARAAEHR